jgi:general secretion pathway protein K
VIERDSVRARRGFAMLTTLWVMTVASVVALVASLAGRNTVSSTRNRVQGERAFWTALACAHRMQATIDEVLQAAPALEGAAAAWRSLGNATQFAPLLQGLPCVIELEAAGTRLDINVASPEMLTRLFRAMGESDERVRSLVDALVDWRDPDDVPEPAGAEESWYASARRGTPRNAPLADIRELAGVRGFEELRAFERVATTEQGRVALSTASVEVLQSVPGITREAAEAIVAFRESGTAPLEAAVVIGQLSRESADEMMSRYSEISRITTPDPEAWIMTTRATHGFPASTAVLSWRLVRAGRRCVVSLAKTSL